MLKRCDDKIPPCLIPVRTFSMRNNVGGEKKAPDKMDDSEDDNDCSAARDANLDCSDRVVCNAVTGIT